MPVRIDTPGPVPKEALAYFRAKKLKVGFDYRDVWREEHAHAFTVAKAMNLDVLTTIREELDRAIADGTTFRDFQKTLRPRLEKLGWWGIKDQRDPLTGEIRKVQLGSPRRLRTIYRANLRTARAAGQWDRIERNKRTHPYLLYRLGPSENHREQHVAWEGLLLPVDDPFWTVHMPPNGWGCKCHVRAVSKREYERLKGSGRVQVDSPPTKTHEWVNKRTGEVTRVPVGIDPGWDTNPGQIARQAQALDIVADKLNAADPIHATSGVSDLLATAGFSAWYKKPEGRFPVGVIKEADAQRINALTHTVKLSSETAIKQARIHPEIKPGDYIHVQATLDRGRRIQDGARSLIYILEEADGFVSVVKATETGKSVFLTSFRRLSRNQVKRDEEIKRLLRKIGR